MFEEHAISILVFSVIFVLLIKWLKSNYRWRDSKLLWFGQVIVTFLLLITEEIVFVDSIDGLLETTYLSYVKIGFDILWWLVPAYLINLATEVFIWTSIEERTRRFIPNLIRIVAATIIYSLAVVGIIIFVYDSVSISLIFFVSSIIIIGFDVQRNLAGISINLERPFRIGDWAKIGEFEEGEVVDMKPLTTHVKTRDECITCIPNRTVLQSTVKNFCYPDNVFWLTTTIKLSDVHAPERAKKILLDAALSANGILKEPAPVVLVTGMTNGAVEYGVSYCGKDYARKIFIKNDVLKRIWFHLNQAGIAPTSQRQEMAE
jgi:branched-chain amino acid transport system substrate-binding protein